MVRLSNMVRFGAIAILAGVLAACTTALPPPPKFAQAFTPLAAAAQNQMLGRGVNVLGYDPLWRDPAQARFTPVDFKLIHDAGFRTVRIALHGFRFMDRKNRLDPDWLTTLDTMVTAALAQGLNVILDEHDFDKCSSAVAACAVKLHAFWSQVAPHYKDAPNRVLFELLNEPHPPLTDAVWNDLLARTLALVRVSNPERNIVIGPGHWNGLESLPALKLPHKDRHIIVTVHYYHPMTFTHQGADWVSKKIEALSNVSWGSQADYALLNKEFDTVKAWSALHDRPIFLGEFGAYDKAPMEYRAKWDNAVARAAEARGFSWAYWQFDPDFSLYDFSQRQFVKPILAALIPR
jgi:endoglucanase